MAATRHCPGRRTRFVLPAQSAFGSAAARHALSIVTQVRGSSPQIETKLESAGCGKASDRQFPARAPLAFGLKVGSSRAITPTPKVRRSLTHVRLRSRGRPTPGRRKNAFPVREFLLQ